MLQSQPTTPTSCSVRRSVRQFHSLVVGGWFLRQETLTKRVQRFHRRRYCVRLMSALIDDALCVASRRKMSKLNLNFRISEFPNFEVSEISKKHFRIFAFSKLQNFNPSFVRAVRRFAVSALSWALFFVVLFFGCSVSPFLRFSPVWRFRSLKFGFEVFWFQIADRSFVHSFIRAFVRSFVRSFVCSFVRSFVRLFVRCFVSESWREKTRAVNQSVS